MAKPDAPNPRSRRSSYRIASGMTSLGLVWGLVGGCFYRVLNPDASSETIAPPGASIRHRIERKVTIEVLTVDRRLIFWGILRTTHSRVRRRKPAPPAIGMAPRRPPSDPIPRRICQPHEFLRAQRTPPQPPDVGGGGPSCPARAAAQPPLPPGQTGAAAGAALLLHSAPCLWRCPAGGFQGVRTPD